MDYVNINNELKESYNNIEDIENNLLQQENLNCDLKKEQLNINEDIKILLNKKIFHQIFIKI